MERHSSYAMLDQLAREAKEAAERTAAREAAADQLDEIRRQAEALLAKLGPPIPVPPQTEAIQALDADLQRLISEAEALVRPYAQG